MALLAIRSSICCVGLTTEAVPTADGNNNFKTHANSNSNSSSPLFDQKATMSIVWCVHMRVSNGYVWVPLQVVYSRDCLHTRALWRLHTCGPWTSCGRHLPFCWSALYYTIPTLSWVCTYIHIEWFISCGTPDGITRVLFLICIKKKNYLSNEYNYMW